MEEIYENMSDREKRIFNAAIDIFSQKGYNAATTKDIAQAAGVAEGTIFRYYKTKKDILNVIMFKMMDILCNVALHPVEQILKNAEGKDLKEVFHDILIDRIKLLEKIYPMGSVVFTEAVFREEIRNAMYDKLYKKAQAAYIMFHQEAVNRGLIRADLRPEAVFRTLFANIALFIAGYKLFPDMLGEDGMEKEFEILLDIILNGIEAKG